MVQIHYYIEITIASQQALPYYFYKKTKLGNPLLKRLLIFTVQVRSGINVKQLSISLKVSNSIIYTSVVGSSTLKPTVDYVGHQPISSRPVSCQVGFRGDIFTNHDIVARWLGLLLGHPEPKSSFKCNQGVVGYYFWVP